MADPMATGSANDWQRSASRHPGSRAGVVAEVVHAVLATMSGDLSAQETSLLAEVEELGHTIACAKAEIAALRVDDITDSHIPFATDELDAIVEHTATATNAILDSCETLDDVAAALTGEPAATAAGRDHAHLRGVQLPGHHRPADHQGRGDPEDDRGQGRADRRDLRQRLSRPPTRSRPKMTEAASVERARSIQPLPWTSRISTSSWPASNDARALAGLLVCLRRCLAPWIRARSPTVGRRWPFASAPCGLWARRVRSARRGRNTAAHSRVSDVLCKFGDDVTIGAAPSCPVMYSASRVARARPNSSWRRATTFAPGGLATAS